MFNLRHQLYLLISKFLEEQERIEKHKKLWLFGNCYANN